MQQLVYGLNQLDLAANFVLNHSAENTIWCFYGEMGAGKTTLIKAICKALKVIDHVSSPTFSLVNAYETEHGKPVFHFDFYRIKSIEEVYDIGYEDYFFSGNICLVEWPQLVQGLLPTNGVMPIFIEPTADGARKLTLNKSL